MIEHFDTYGDVLDAWVTEKRADEDNVEREPKFYASSFGTCHRKMVMQRAGIEGTPMSVDSMRNLEERSILHDARLKQLLSKGALIAADTGTPYAREAAPTTLSDAFPDGFGCRADGIGHVRCHCQRETFPLPAEGLLLNQEDLVHIGRVSFRFTLRAPGPLRKPKVTLLEEEAA